jgi:hypothetical protein
MARVVEHLLSKHEALSSNHITAKKRKTQLGMVVHVFNPSTPKAKAGGLSISGQQ